MREVMHSCDDGEEFALRGTVPALRLRQDAREEGDWSLRAVNDLSTTSTATAEKSASRIQGRDGWGNCKTGICNRALFGLSKACCVSSVQRKRRDIFNKALSGSAILAKFFTNRLQ